MKSGARSFHSGRRSLHKESFNNPITCNHSGLSAYTYINYFDMEIPQGNNPEDAKARKNIIGAIYSTWIAANPEKKVWNSSLGAYIHIKFKSINETKGQASVSYESTRAVLSLDEILRKAVVVKTTQPKKNDKSQRPYDLMLILLYKGIRLVVGHQQSTNEYVQYCITKK